MTIYQLFIMGALFAAIGLAGLAVAAIVTNRLRACERPFALCTQCGTVTTQNGICVYCAESNFREVEGKRGIVVHEGALLTDDRPTDPYNTAQFHRF